MQSPSTRNVRPDSEKGGLVRTQRTAIAWILAFCAGRFEGAATDAAHVLSAGHFPLPFCDHVELLDLDFHDEEMEAWCVVREKEEREVDSRKQTSDNDYSR